VSDTIRDVMRPIPQGVTADAMIRRFGDVCSRELTTVAPDGSVGQAVRLMREKAIRRLPVVDGDEVVGSLTLGDIAIQRDSRTALADISAAPPNT